MKYSKDQLFYIRQKKIVREIAEGFFLSPPSLQVGEGALHSPLSKQVSNFVPDNFQFWKQENVLSEPGLKPDPLTLLLNSAGISGQNFGLAKNI